jgi:hypothetical protein
VRAQIVWEIIQMLILSIKDSLFKACHNRQRYRCGFSKGQGYYEMACIEECPGSAQLHGFSMILSMVCRGIFEYIKSDHEIAEEEQEVCLDR